MDVSEAGKDLIRRCEGQGNRLIWNQVNGGVKSQGFHGN